MVEADWIVVRRSAHHWLFRAVGYQRAVVDGLILYRRMACHETLMQPALAAWWRAGEAREAGFALQPVLLGDQATSILAALIRPQPYAPPRVAGGR